MTHPRAKNRRRVRSWIAEQLILLVEGTLESLKRQIDPPEPPPPSGNSIPELLAQLRPSKGIMIRGPKSLNNGDEDDATKLLGLSRDSRLWARRRLEERRDAASPLHAGILNTLGCAYVLVGAAEYDEAEKAFERADDTATPDYPDQKPTAKSMAQHNSNILKRIRKLA